MRRLMVGVLGCALALGGCVQGIARSRVQAALIHAGLPQPMAECMATRMVDRLTIAQLRKLEALRGTERSALDYAMAVQRVGDPQVIEVTMNAAGACAGQISGLDGLLH